MDKTDNLYNALRGLEKNMSRLANESRYLDYEIMKIFSKRMQAEKKGFRIQDDEMHHDRKYIELANGIIARNERRIRFQRELHASLLETFNDLIAADLRRIIMKQFA